MSCMTARERINRVMWNRTYAIWNWKETRTTNENRTLGACIRACINRFF